MTSTSLWRPLMETAISLTQGWTSMRFPCNLLNFLEYPKISQRIRKYFPTSIRALQIVIGGFGNTISLIRRGMQGRTLGEAQVILFFSLVFFLKKYNVFFFNVQCLCWDGFSSLSSFVLVTGVDFLKLIWLSFRFFSFWHWGSFKFAFFG